MVIFNNAQTRHPSREVNALFAEYVIILTQFVLRLVLIKYFDILQLQLSNVSPWIVYGVSGKCLDALRLVDGERE